MRRREAIKLGLAIGGGLLGAPGSAGAERPGRPSRAAAPPAPGSDLALVNGKLLTLDAGRPDATAALVRGGRIALVGTDREVRAQAGSARVFDARGRVVVPGFIDAHTHFEYTCLWNAYQVDCHTPPHRDIAGVLGALRAKASRTPPGRWVIGRGGGLPDGFAEKRMPTREEMDSVSQDHPVILLSFMHVGVVNTRGLEELGLRNAADVAAMTWPGGKPRVGSAVARDASGTPTGIVTEIWELLPPYPMEEIKAAIRTWARPMFVEKGITSASTMPFHISEFRASQELLAAGELPIRLRTYYNLPQVISVQGLLESGLKPGFGDDMIRFGGVKAFVTGAGSDGQGHRINDYKYTQAELDDLVARLHAADIQVCMHVSGDADPIERSIRAVEAAQRANPKPIRHRLEHAAQLAQPDHVRRLLQAGMRVTITRAQRSTGAGAPFDLFVREGLEPMAISDTTGSVPFFSPIAGIAALVRPGVTFDDALRMWTLWAARGNAEERDKGSIEAGKLGDFAVLSRDPRPLPAAELYDVQVDATILGGDVLFERG